jgi:hypothetical protein
MCDFEVLSWIILVDFFVRASLYVNEIDILFCILYIDIYAGVFLIS